MGRGGARAEPGDEAAAGEDPEGDECGFAGFNEEALRPNRMLQGRRRVPAAEAKHANRRHRPRSRSISAIMASSSEQNINSGSFSGTDLSKKRLKESVSQTPELSERTIKIVYKRKRLADKKVGGSKLAATDEESTELNNDDDKGDGTGKAVHQEYTCLAESLAIENLPFMKTSSMWEYLESMEVFRNIPQRPNFSKFQQHVPELREGMASGLMISFTSLADNIKRLSIHDDDALFQEKMKGLSSLEADGFDVRRLRS